MYIQSRKPFSEENWSSVETLPIKEIRKIQDENLRRQVLYISKNSTFYKQKFSQYGIDLSTIRTIEDLARLPLTDKQELRDSLAACPPLGSHVAADRRDIVQIQASSGTTGSPSYVGLTASDIHVWCELGARAWYAGGFRPGDRLLHCFGMSKGFVGGLPVVQIAQYMGIVDIPIGAEAGAERLLRVQADHRPEALIGTPHFLTYLGERAPEILAQPASALGVRAMCVGGEPGGGMPAVRKNLESIWGATVSEILGGTDIASSYWGECKYGDGMHFLSPDLMVAEIIDPVTEQGIKPVSGASGELVYTALQRQASPLVRFRTGDQVVVTGVNCRCGRTGFKVKCVGRTDDMLIVRGINLYPSSVKDLVLSLKPLTTGEMRIIAKFRGHSTQAPLPLIVEYAGNPDLSSRDDLRRRIEERIRSALNVKVVVELVPEGTLKKPDQTKTVLLERVVAN